MLPREAKSARQLMLMMSQDDAAGPTVRGEAAKAADTADIAADEEGVEGKNETAKHVRGVGDAPGTST